MPDANILVIAIDGLRASALGAYGNTTYPTPALDQLAAESFLFDQCYANSPDLAMIYRALWNSEHPLCMRTTGGDSLDVSLPRLSADRGYATTLITDEPAVAKLPEASLFAEHVTLAESSAARAESIGETATARLFAAAYEQLQSDIPLLDDEPEQESPRLVWLHARGMYGPWDAPLELQESLLERDEGDPSPCESIEPPDLMLDAESDPDAVFRSSCGYAAQLVALDACLEGLLELLNELPSGEQWLVVVCGVRGFPLGEHHRIGGVDERLFAEQLHVPLLWRFPDGCGRLARCFELVSHLDVLPSLLELVGSESQDAFHGFDGRSLLPLARRQALDDRRPIIASSATGCRSLRTDEWSLRCEPADASTMAVDDDETRRELYVRPDDRWEANDVADLCPDVVAELSSLLDSPQLSCESNGTAPASDDHPQIP